MRNLKLQYSKELAHGVQHIKHVVVRPDDTVYFVTDSKIYACNNAANQTPKVIAELPHIVSAEYYELDDVICVATGAGEVLLINPDTLASSEGTFCDVGIECMSWSPNQDVVAFITKKHNVVLMTCTYDVLVDEPLNAEISNDQQFVNVGWGKKETQFHGAAGKQAAKQTNNFQEPQNVDELSQDISIAWRGDGAYFVVSYVSPTLGRTFKVYDGEGKLQFAAEKSNGLQPPLTWRPSGNWIAVPQVFPNKSTVALFEKNGLRHREFVLPFDLLQEPIVQLRWNTESDILALLTSTPEGQRIYLYTICNYHWYLKQVLTYTPNNPLALFHWDSRYGHEHTLHVLLDNGKQLSYRWHFAVNRYENTGVVGVIDGKRLLLTDFAKAVVPPPMCQRVLLLDDYINAFTWFETSLCVYTCERNLYFYEPMQQLNQEPIPMHMQPDTELSTLHLANLTFFNSEYLLATHSVGGNTRLLLLNKEADLEDEEDISQACYKVQSMLRINGTVNALSVGANAMDEFYVQTVENSNTYQVSLKPDNSLKVERSYLELGAPADQIEWFTLNSDSSGGLITLSSQCLQVDNHRVSTFVTSFCVAGNYLAYTQLDNLNFVRLRDKRLVYTRNMERGAKLVAAISNAARVVLQLPRGNLEMINPRVLALDLVGSLLQYKQYQAAMQMLRKQRINLNILCDHNVVQFVENIGTFLREIKQTQWLCLFLSELQNEDFSKGMYSSNYDAAKQVYPADFNVQYKVQYICELLCQRMLLADQPKQIEHFHLPIITAYVKLGKLESALKIIWKQKQQDAIASTRFAEDMLKYLLYLVDINELYNVALGLYDFGLILFVAQKSQKDPKEYLPYLNELKALEPNYGMFKIDEHLKRYKRALEHLAACGETHYEQALQFIKQHTLYKEALICYSSQVPFYKQVCVAYADYLRANARFENASLMYERGGELPQALLSAKHTLDWQRVLMLAQRTKDLNIENLAMTMVGPLEQQNRYLEAYELIRTHTQADETQQLQVLVNGHLYLRAIYETRIKGHLEFLSDIVQPALVGFANKLLDTLCCDSILFADYRTRLLAIRQRQKLQPNDDYAGLHNDIDEVDLLSDTSSLHSSRYTTSSRGTGKTFRSSKNRRKHERKLFSLKPGNPFEDIALIDALHNHITKIGLQQLAVRDTCKALLELTDVQLDELASRLQREYKTLLTTVEAALDEIWIPELAIGNGQLPQHLSGPNVDYMALQKEQRYALLSPLKRFKPQMNVIDWQQDVLN